MKTKAFLLVISLFLFSCTENTPDTLSKEEINQTKTEIKTIVKKMVAYSEHANADSMLTFFYNTPEFVYVSHGQSLNYSEMANVMRKYFAQISVQKYNLINEKVSFPAQSLVFYTGHFISQTNFKNGDTVVLRPFIQFFTFKKIENNWKVIYGAESFMPKSARKIELK